MPKKYSEIYASVHTDKNKMDFSNSMIRGNGIPLDITEVYGSLNAAIKYAATDPVAYEGQLLAVTENNDTNVYVIGSVSQGTVEIDGAQVINYLKLVGKETDLTNYYTKEEIDALMPSVPNITIVDDTEAEVPETDTINVYKNLTANGQILTEELVQVVTAAGLKKVKDSLEQKITAGMTFKGTITSLPLEAEVGDTYKVYGENISIKIDDIDAKSGDTVIYGIDPEATSESLVVNKWYLIPTGDDIEDTWRPVVGVKQESSLTFNAGDKLDVEVKEDGSISYSHEKIDAPVLNEGGSGRTYITELISDEHGHIIGYKSATEVDQTIPDPVAYELDSSSDENKVNLILRNNQEQNNEDIVTLIGAGATTINKNENGEVVITSSDSQYSAGDGLDLTEGVFKVEVDEKALVIDENKKVALKLSTDTADEGYLNIAADGLQIKGINEAIADHSYSKSEVYTKSETDQAITDKVASVTGGESAAAVKLALESYRDAANKEIWGDEAGEWTTTTTEDGETKVVYTPAYGSESRIDKLEKVGAQANLIESISTLDGALDITSKNVVLPTASVEKVGLVKSSEAENGIVVADNGEMSVNSVNVTKLTQTENEWVILNGGNASLIKNL